MTKEEAKKMGATHINNNGSIYLYEELYYGEKGDWYRYHKSKKAWVEILSKPRNIKPL